MKITALPLAVCVLISGCANLVTPNSSDRTRPTLSFMINHSSPDIDSPSTEDYTVRGMARGAGRCVYVKSPFRVIANAADDGGIREIWIRTIIIRGPEARESEADDIFAINAPDQPIQFAEGDGTSLTFDNPGKNPVSGQVRVHYVNSRAWDGAVLSAVYEFGFGVSEGIFAADAYNFRVDPVNNTESREAGRSQIWGYKVKLAGPDDTPGDSCE